MIVLISVGSPVESGGGEEEEEEVATSRRMTGS
jgi:hypothetical protein